ncbi:hypothetical protein [Chitinophaga sp. Cy-1792]|uniref:hypothetical protein n=1 Tax=Chitinophaga sp. Cy-1792 TaxID=2608339 RepID=UPI0014206A42|nr:hypothetical protein [Chitinophaga sp. Cy-1792]NIG56005.1 hypothetical protein [Chitinophaga sp. Cy-1792]
MNRKSMKWLGSMLLTFSLMAGAGKSYGQARRGVDAPLIATMARPSGDSIMLRWAPVNAVLWRAANANGYIIKRYTVARNKQLLKQPEIVTLTGRPLKPLPLAAWEPIVQRYEKPGSIAAQALYGEKFEVTATDKKKGKADPMTIYHQSEEQETRFSFGLYAAEQSYEVAKAMGLGFVDRNVKPDEKYLYRIFLAVTPAGLPSDTGYIYTGLDEYQPLPKPAELKAGPLDKAALISWNKINFERFYNAWILERSDDNGKTFTSVSKEPLINTQDNPKDQVNYFYRLDTALHIDQVYAYRVRGISAFGEIGPVSDTVQVTIHDLLTVHPTIVDVEDQQGVVYIRWRMPQSKAKIVRYDIERSAAVNKKYTVLNKVPLLEKDSIFADQQPMNVNYYRIKATTKDGQHVYSFPHFIQQEDSIPPVAPVALAGTINKAGVVSLSWEPNKEKDLYGYRVFRANAPQEEFVQVTRNPADSAFFSDTISINTLTKNVYYKVVALDKHYNPSPFSEMLTLKRPDIIPPVPPLFVSSNASAEGIALTWILSTSADVECHQLMRRKDSVWESVLYLPKGDTTVNYTDTSSVAGVKYTYQLIAIDDSGLQGASKLLNAARIDMGNVAAKDALKVSVDRENKLVKLSWQALKGVNKVWIYKATADGTFRLIKTVEGTETTTTDAELLLNTIYKYKLRMMDTVNGRSGFTSEVIVNY